MRIYFAMDLLNGEVVRAFRGDREGYGPIHLSSRVLKRSDLFYTVKTIKPRYLYIADLDRIMGKGDNKKKIEEISKEVKHLIADCGFRNPSELDEIEFDPVLGTETFNVRLLSKVKKRAFVSLDIKNDLLDVSKSFKNWKEALFWLNSFDLEGVVMLMLDRVGTSLSPNFSMLEKAVKLSANPILAGGGIKDIDDLFKAKDVGCEGVLISTAVHEGRVTLKTIRQGKI